MSTIDNGGPAFPSGLIEPSTPEDVLQPVHTGMMLRDYFAAKAMQTLLGSEYRSDQGLTEGWPKQLAHEAYLMADAMIKAREGGAA